MLGAKGSVATQATGIAALADFIERKELRAESVGVVKQFERNLMVLQDEEAVALQSVEQGLAERRTVVAAALREISQAQRRN